ncbi:MULTISPECIES: hypothetical protein [Erwinia]|uniref:Uncharacterized protein n=1 Tax=Erwinia papayae TaxID=206499 RepID=A0ABV3N4P7_9GAMM|nr:hypothetical protein [Erwinia mallotivora]
MIAASCLPDGEKRLSASDENEFTPDLTRFKTWRNYLNAAAGAFNSVMSGSGLLEKIIVRGISAVIWIKYK